MTCLALTVNTALIGLVTISTRPTIVIVELSITVPKYGTAGSWRCWVHPGLSACMQVICHEAITASKRKFLAPNDKTGSISKKSLEAYLQLYSEEH
jgi:hypothetical protein